MAPKKGAAAIKLAHELLTKARDEGSEDAAWQDIFKSLRKTPAALKRPEPRKLSLLHQAAYWGHRHAVETLLKEFSADPNDVTADEEKLDAEGVARTQGHEELAKYVKDFVDKADSKKSKAPTPEDTKIAHELLDKARDHGSEDVTWKGIFTKLRAHPAALARPEPRKMSLLHQAAYWGNKSAVEILVHEFGADPTETTHEDEKQDVATVAEAQGHASVAAFVRELVTKVSAAKSSACEEEEEEEPHVDEVDESAAESPYIEKNNNAGEKLEGAVEIWLCLRGLGKDAKWEAYNPSQNADIAVARSAGKPSIELDSLEGKRILDLKNMRETSTGTHRKAVCFSVLWEWDEGDGGKALPKWQVYPPQAQWQLEAAMCAADATCEVKTPAGKKYVVDLVGLRQHSSSDAFRTRRIRRRGVPLRQVHPPRVRDVVLNTWLDLSSQPDYWKGASNGAGTRRYDLPADSHIVSQISQWINCSIRTGHTAAFGQVPGHGGPFKGAEVVRVEVVEQPALWRRYCCYKGQMRAQSSAIKTHPGTKYLEKNPMALPRCEWLDADVNEAYFWHGSGKSSDGSIDLIDAIVSVGHEPSDENSEIMEVSDGASSRFAKNSSMFGSGVYLADISSKANLYVPCPVCHQGAYFRDPCHCSKKDVDKAPPYRMLLCRAVLGRVYVERKYQDARYKGEFNPAKKLGADAVMGEALPGQLAFREYVVYSDSASYPEFVVHYRRLPHAVVHKAAGPPPKKKAKKG